MFRLPKHYIIYRNYASFCGNSSMVSADATGTSLSRFRTSVRRRLQRLWALRACSRFGSFPNTVSSTTPPFGPYLGEGMLCCCSPENVFAAVVISDQRMLQAEPVGYGANARSFESSFGKFRDSGIEDRGSCRK